MTERYNRPSDDEFAARSLETKCLEAEVLLDLLFLDEGKLRVTQSGEGVPRVRAIIGDPDGWAECETPAGVAKLVDSQGTKYVAEQRMGLHKGPVYMWQLNISTHELELTVLTDQGALAYSSADLEPGTDPIEDLEMRWSTFTQCIQWMNGYLGKDYEREVERFPVSRYNFRTPELRDNPLPL